MNYLGDGPVGSLSLAALFVGGKSGVRKRKRKRQQEVERLMKQRGKKIDEESQEKKND